MNYNTRLTIITWAGKWFTVILPHWKSRDSFSDLAQSDKYAVWRQEVVCGPGITARCSSVFLKRYRPWWVTSQKAGRGPCGWTVSLRRSVSLTVTDSKVYKSKLQVRRTVARALTSPDPLRHNSANTRLRADQARLCSQRSQREQRASAAVTQEIFIGPLHLTSCRWHHQPVSFFVWNTGPTKHKGN